MSETTRAILRMPLFAYRVVISLLYAIATEGSAMLWCVATILLTVIFGLTGLAVGIMIWALLLGLAQIFA
jgi:hypothetical protein